MKLSETSQNEKNHEFFRLMTVIGERKRITTPSYAEFIEVLAFTFDQKSGDRDETTANAMSSSRRNPRRADAMSASRSMRSKQVAYEQILPKLFSVWGIEKEGYGALETVFLKIENLLSHLKSTTIHSTRRSDYGEWIFFKDIGLPQMIEILRSLSETEDDGFWPEMLGYLVDIIRENKTARECITKLKIEVKSLLDGRHAPDFRVWRDKLNVRSFPKTKRIDNSLAGLRDELLKDNLRGAGLDDLIIKLKYKFMAAKASLAALKFIENNPYSKSLPLHTDLTEAHNQLCVQYILNKNCNEFNFEFDTCRSFALLKTSFLHTIENLSRENIPPEFSRTAGNLLRYEDGAFLPWCAFKKFIFDLNKGNVDETYISIFEKMFLSTAKNYQYGHLGVLIASCLLAMKIKTSDFIPHRSLEPLAMTAILNTAIGVERHFNFATPYGPGQPVLTETSEFNVAKAVGSFNEAVKTTAITQSVCNPLENLDEILKSIFDQIDEEKLSGSEFKFLNRLKKRPIKTVSWDLYDTLKNINELLYWHNLFESKKSDADSVIYVEKSLAGNFIDKYLALSNPQKREILSKISPEQCSADTEKVQSAR
jgi:hypothetical protein